MCFFFICFFFFSSRRRHTRCLSDWSSDVCSSDLPRCSFASAKGPSVVSTSPLDTRTTDAVSASCRARSEEHTSELQSLRHLVCRLLLEKKKEKDKRMNRRTEQRTRRRRRTAPLRM